MSHAELMDQIDTLPVDEKLRLVEEIWGRIAAHPDRLLVPDSHSAEVERRLKDHIADPGGVLDWDEVKAELRSGR
jgi:putative addiction module component (TIGR02574 family)